VQKKQRSHICKVKNNEFKKKLNGDIYIITIALNNIAGYYNTTVLVRLLQGDHTGHHGNKKLYAPLTAEFDENVLKCTFRLCFKLGHQCCCKKFTTKPRNTDVWSRCKLYITA